MNKTFNIQSMHRRLVAAAATIVLTLAITLSAGCQANKQEVPSTDSVAHHELYGIWSLDFTRPADSQKEIYPPFKRYGFYSDDIFFSPHFWARDGHTMAFGYSGEELKVKDGQVIFTDGLPSNHRFVSENTFQATWKKKKGDNSLVAAEEITDQWTRTTPDSVMMRLFHTACKAEQAHEKPLDGVWMGQADEDNWLFINGNTLLQLAYVQPDSTVNRFSGSGFFFLLTYGEDHTFTLTGGNEEKVVHWESQGEDVITITTDDGTTQTLTRCKSLPQNIRRILNATLIENP